MFNLPQREYIRKFKTVNIAMHQLLLHDVENIRRNFDLITMFNKINKAPS